MANRDAQNSDALDVATSTNNAQTRNISTEDIKRFNQALGSPTTKDSFSSELRGQTQSQVSSPTPNASKSYTSQSGLSAIFSSLMNHNNNNSNTEVNTSGQNTHFDQKLEFDSLQAASLASPSATFTAPSTIMEAVTHNTSNASDASSSFSFGANSSIQNLINHMVEQILVSDPKFSQGSEVRLLLGINTGSLQGSEIILRRNLEGMLAVEINCHNQNQFKKFVEIRNDLKTALEQHEDQECYLLINQPTL